VEARELVDQLGKTVMDLEKGAAPGLVARLLRLAHTLKGAARVVKQRDIGDQAHAVEGVLTPYRESTAPLPRDRIEALLGLLDDIGLRVAALAEPSDPEGADPLCLRPAEPLRTVRADITEMDELLDGVTEAHARLGPLRESLGEVERARHLAERLAGGLETPASGENLGGRSQASTDRLRSMADELKALFGGIERSLALGVDRMERELKQVRGAAEHMRLVPAASLFTSLERTARDAAQTLGKRVIFEGRGGDVRLEAHLLDAVQGALTQVVRNAVAHGIEPERDRVDAGKSPEGHVVLVVARRGRRVVFTGEDDGRGVDLEAVRRAAQRGGPLSAETRRLGPEDLLRLLLKGGISTSGSVTEVSGRGVGLDVVRESAESLGGEVNLRTERGKGTRVELSVPLSLASVEVLLVEAGGVLATIPLVAVRGTSRIAASDVVRTASGESVVNDGRVIPFVPLSRVLSGRHPLPRGARPWSAVLVQGGEGLAAVGADRLLGTANVVFRPLPDLAPAGAVVAGASMDEEGNPRIVLDPDALVAEAGRSAAPGPEPAATWAPVLVIDDSLTTRMLERSILESAGYEVDVATSGEEALEKARRREYALFLVDVEMPGMDGFTFVERIHADPALRDIPSILVTSRGEPEDRRRGEEVGALAYIVKSEFDQRTLLERIRELVV